MEPFHHRLLSWYDRHARSLPWRVPPQEGKLGVLPDPYHVWLSEVMLQQTTVATVKSYFDKFVSTWPRVEDLAAADLEDVLKAWAGLGYYSRARNLKACADIIMRNHGGRFPSSQAELVTLPGVGDYTSAAIAAIAFGEKAAVVDGNIERVVTRQTANPTPLPQVKEACRSFMRQHTPAESPGDFVQAMMDLGATICTPKNPACALCPVNGGCAARAAGSMLDYPVKAPKKKKPVRTGHAFVIERSDGSVWLEKRAQSGLLAGMTSVPTTNWDSTRDGIRGSEKISSHTAIDWRNSGTVRHTFTHFHLELDVLCGTSEAVESDGWWSPRDQLREEALPTVFKKVISTALPDAFAPVRDRKGKGGRG